MTKEQVDRPVKVSSTVRAHPAIVRLARACIALARWQREQAAESAASTEEPAAAHTDGAEQAKEDRRG
jgi:hypothetical protein